MLAMPENFFFLSAVLCTSSIRGCQCFNCFTAFMLATLEGGHRIIHNTVNFETLQLVASVAGERKAKFYSATIITLR